jgi:hypothetical protein
MPGVGIMPKPKADVVFKIIKPASYFSPWCQVCIKIIAGRGKNELFVQALNNLVLN